MGIVDSKRNEDRLLTKQLFWGTESFKEPLPSALNIPTLNMIMLDCMPDYSKQLATLVAAVGDSVIKKILR